MTHPAVLLCAIRTTKAARASALCDDRGAVGASDL